MLELNNVEVLYSDVILAVKGITAKVPAGQCVTLLGANGAGKSTTLKAISNLVRTEDGRVTAGSIQFDGADITGANPVDVVRKGLVHVMEGRKVLRHMTVEQNLVVGGHMGSAGDAKEMLDEVYSRIKRLKALRTRTAGYLSGGEQQLLVIGRALMAKPKLVMIDEPSLGLAPLMVDEVYGLLSDLKTSGLTLLIVEQNTRVALDLADYGCDGERTDRVRGPLQQLKDQRGRSRVLPRPDGRWGAQEFPRHETLPPPQALAGLTALGQSFSKFSRMGL